MATKLDKTLRREIEVGNEPYVVTIDPEGLLLTAKGRRKGLQLQWRDLISGQAALATALNASLAANLAPSKAAKGKAGKKRQAPRRR